MMGDDQSTLDYSLGEKYILYRKTVLFSTCLAGLRAQFQTTSLYRGP